MKIIFTVTNDLSYDQRMQRICGTLSANGYEALLVGRTLPHSIALTGNVFQQKRLSCFFNKGFLFYGEYNIRLFFFLLFLRSYDVVCSIDVDTLPAGFMASLLRGRKRVFDAHEYFSEVPEVVDRPFVKFFWDMTARCILPFYRHAYTVGPALAAIFQQRYGPKFAVIRNVAAAVKSPTVEKVEKIILYQGALNEGRGLEAAIEAMQYLENVQLIIAGEGDISTKLRAMCLELGLESKVHFKGFVPPEALKQLTAEAWLGLNLLENRGLSYYYSLANKFFDCVQAGIPVLTMNFPEYKALNAEFEVAYLLDALNPVDVANALTTLLENKDLYEKLQHNCLLAREVWTWENESRHLLDFWAAV